MMYSVKSVFRNKVSFKYSGDGRKLDHSIVDEYSNLEVGEVMDAVREFLDVNPSEPEPAVVTALELPDDVRNRIVRGYKRRFDLYNIINNDISDFSNSSDSERSYETSDSMNDINVDNRDILEDSIIISKY